MRTSLLLTLFALALVLSMGVTLYGFLKVEQERSVLLEGQAPLYIPRPRIAERAFLGSAEAPVTLVVFASPGLGQAQRLFAQLGPALEGNVSAGVMRVYLKQAVGTADLRENGARLARARRLACLERADADGYFAAWRSGDEELINLSLDSPAKERYDECLQERLPQNLRDDIEETERLGLVGVGPRLFLGVGGRDSTAIDGIPGAERFRRILRSYTTQLGD